MTTTDTVPIQYATYTNTKVLHFINDQPTNTHGLIRELPKKINLQRKLQLDTQYLSSDGHVCHESRMVLWSQGISPERRNGYYWLNHYTTNDTRAIVSNEENHQATKQIEACRGY